MVEISSSSDLLVLGCLAAGSETKKGLKCSSRRLAEIVPKDEFIEVYLELGRAHTVVRTNEPPLKSMIVPKTQY